MRKNSIIRGSALTGFTKKARAENWCIVTIIASRAPTRVALGKRHISVVSMKTAETFLQTYKKPTRYQDIQGGRFLQKD